MLGVDPGSSSMGVAVLRIGARRTELVYATALRATKSWDLPRRLAQLDEQFEELIEFHRPDLVAVEGPAHAKGFRSVAALGSARAIPMIRAVRLGAALAILAPSHAKKHVTGRGNADKEQVAEAVGRIVQGCAGLPHDATDAVAVALTGWANIAGPGLAA